MRKLTLSGLIFAVAVECIGKDGFQDCHARAFGKATSRSLAFSR